MILFGIRGSASIINPILLAAVITITVLPVPSRLTKRGMPVWLALVLSILMVVVLLALVIATVFFSVTKLSTELPTYMASASQQASADLSATADSETSAQIESVTISVGPVLQGLLANVINILVQFGLALVIFFFMISAALAMPAPSRLGLDPDQPVIGRVAALTEDVRKYMTVLTGVNFLVALGDTIFLWILGVDFAVLWGLLAWFMGYIPSIGFMIALIPPVLLAYAQYGLQTALIVLIGYILINGGVQNFYQPKVMGDRLKISPVIVFVGLFIWGYLLGGIGAILAVPLTLLVLIIMENFEGTRPLAILMRYTGEAREEEREEAMKDIKGLWGRVKGTSILAVSWGIVTSEPFCSMLDGEVYPPETIVAENMKRKVHVSINPASGRPKPVLHILNSAFKQAEVEWDISLTKVRGDAKRFAREAVVNGADIVAANGGDGTVMEAAQGLLASSIPLAILPGGLPT